MQQQPTAKIFLNGGSQAVRLPAEFRFDDASEVYIRRDPATGDVILSTRSATDWASFVALREREGPVTDDFMADREQPSEDRDPFRGWQE